MVTTRLRIMSENDFEIGDLVWARVDGDAAWPGKIAEPVGNRRKHRKLGSYCVFIFGHHTYKWFHKQDIYPYMEFRNGLVNSSNSSDFKRAVKEIEDLVEGENLVPDVFSENTYKKFKKGDDVTEVPKSDVTRIGFLGLGLMGSSMVRNLIKMDFKVNVWDYSPSRCTDFILELDKDKRKCIIVHKVPCNVIRNSDVVFSCLTDTRAVEEVINGSHGILQTSLQGKGFVEMTTVDPDRSKFAHDAIETNGGRYLEAPVQGDAGEARSGTLIVLAGGNFSLFNECKSCFEAMCRIAIYLGDVGYAAKMNVVLRLIRGITLAGLAEGLTLADRSGIYFPDVFEILGLTELNSTYLMDKLRIVIKKKFEESDHHIQDDLQLALQLSEMAEKPVAMYLTSMASEMFKHANLLGYDQQESASVFVRAQHRQCAPDSGVLLSLLGD